MAQLFTYVCFSTLNIIGLVLFLGNKAAGNGTAMYLSRSQVFIKETTVFNGNTGDNRGGVYIESHSFLYSHHMKQSLWATRLHRMAELCMLI